MRIARSMLGRLADYALPPRCAGCSAILTEEHRLCADCWSGLRFLGAPCCTRCRLPFEFDRGGGAVCAPCLADPPAHDGIYAAVAYGDVASQLALRLKYGRRIALAETMARLMRRDWPHGVDMLVPVPLHRWRIWVRSFNQAALIADALGRHHGVPVERDLLRRTRATAPLRGLNPRDRAKTVRGAFALRDDATQLLTGRTVALVDDVYTSGATTSACVRLLKRAGAARVPVVAWARVLPDSGD